MRKGRCACPESYKAARRCKPGKHPIGDLVPNAHEDATTDPTVVSTWWTLWPDANIGIALDAAGLIDVAPDSLEYHAEFIARGLPTTMHFASGGGLGHEHWLFHRGDIPAVRIARSGLYDVLSDGYCVAPPSVHESGRTYEWLDQVAPVEAPEWVGQFVAECIAEREAVSDEPVTPSATSEPPLELSAEQRQVWDNQAAVGQRSDALVDIARMLCEAGYQDVEGIASILAERDETLGLHKYSRRRDASLRYREIAERYGKPPLQAHVSGVVPRYRPLSTSIGEPPREKKQPPEGVEIFDPITWRNHRETAALRPPKIEWLVDKVIARGLITELVAKVKLGKTTFALGAVRAGIAGDDEYCGRAVRPFRALYFTEEGFDTFLVEMQDYGLNDLIDNDAFFTVFDFERERVTPDNKPVTLEMVIDSVLYHASDEVDLVDVIILDTLSIIAGLDEEDHSGKAAAAMAEVRRLTTAGHAVVILRHSRKSGGELGDAGRGSSAISGYCDILLQIEPFKGDEDSTNLRQLRSRGRGIGVVPPLILEFDAENQRYSASGEIQTREERLAAAIKATLIAAKAFDFERAMSTNAITLATKGNRAGIQREIKAMGERGELHHAERGSAVVYWIDEPLTAHLTGVVPAVLEPVEPIERSEERV
jgi:hypothetical protein